MTLNTDTAEFRTATIRQEQAAIAGTQAANPLLPGKFTKMTSGTDGDEPHRLPPPSARGAVYPHGVQVEAAHLARARMPIPARETLGWDI